MTSTRRQSIDNAVLYLASRGALPKLEVPVSCLMESPRHGELLRRKRDARLAEVPRRGVRALLRFAF